MKGILRQVTEHAMKGLLVLSACMAQAGCEPESTGGNGGSDKNDEQEYSIGLQAKSLTLESGAASGIVQFTATGKWTAAVASAASSWCSIVPDSGEAGSCSVAVTVAENDSYDERNAAITIVCGTARETVTVTQKQKDAIIVESGKIEMGADGGAFSLTVRSNVSCSVEIDGEGSSWIHRAESSTRGLSSSSVSFTVDANGELSRREGRIIVSSGELSEEVIVYQAGAEPVFVISAKAYSVPAAGETIKIEISSNVEYDYTLPDADWISEQKTKAVSSYTHYIIVAENAAYDSREAEIIFRNRQTEASDTVRITQLQKDAIIVAKSQYNVDWQENTLSFPVSANVDFVVMSDSDWIRQEVQGSLTKGLVEKQLVFRIDKNPLSEERTGKVSIAYGTTGQTVTIVQAARADKMLIDMSHSETDFYAVSFYGDNLYGTVSWGDGSVTDFTENHTYSGSAARIVRYEMFGVDKFSIPSLNSISSIVIYLPEDQ